MTLRKRSMVAINARQPRDVLARDVWIDCRHRAKALVQIASAVGSEVFARPASRASAVSNRRISSLPSSSLSSPASSTHQVMPSRSNTGSDTSCSAMRPIKACCGAPASNSTNISPTPCARRIPKLRARCPNSSLITGPRQVMPSGRSNTGPRRASVRQCDPLSRRLLAISIEPSSCSIRSRIGRQPPTLS